MDKETKKLSVDYGNNNDVDGSLSKNNVVNPKNEGSNEINDEPAQNPGDSTKVKTQIVPIPRGLGAQVRKLKVKFKSLSKKWRWTIIAVLAALLLGLILAIALTDCTNNGKNPNDKNPIDASVTSITDGNIDGLSIYIEVGVDVDAIDLSEIIGISKYATWELISKNAEQTSIPSKRAEGLRSGDNEFYVSVVSNKDRSVRKLYTITIHRKEPTTSQQYTITFYSNEGNAIPPIEKTSGTPISPPSEPVRLGFEFGGWYTDNNTFANEYVFVNMPSENISLYAKWMAPTQYTITFYSNEGNAIPPIEKTAGTPISPPSEPVRLGFEFGGWYTDNNTFSNEYVFVNMPSENISLYAKWSGIPLNIGTYLRINAEGQPDSNGDYILFGAYPQTLATSSAIAQMGTIVDTNGYYTSAYDGRKYAMVVATLDPYSTGYTFSTGATISNGSAYYFKVEPIKWRILQETGGTALIFCENILANMSYDQISNRYGDSYVREWLNNEFYNTAFDDLQKALILVTEVDNSVFSTGYEINPYAGENTHDHIFLPSHRDICNTSYGFNNDCSINDPARRKLPSDFAGATGAYMSTDQSYFRYGQYWLRSPVKDTNLLYVRAVSYGGTSMGGNYFGGKTYGAVPALRIQLS